MGNVLVTSQSLGEVAGSIMSFEYSSSYTSLKPVALHYVRLVAGVGMLMLHFTQLSLAASAIVTAQQFAEVVPEDCVDIMQGSEKDNRDGEWMRGGRGGRGCLQEDGM